MGDVAVALQLSTHAATGFGASGDALYWGQMESYHWDVYLHRPVAFTGVRFSFRRLPAPKTSRCVGRSRERDLGNGCEERATGEVCVPC